MLNLLPIRKQAEDTAANLPALMHKAQNVAESIIHGPHARRKTGSGEKFWQFREYTPGDRPQDIDWRQSAKGDHIYIRQKEWQAAQKFVFWSNKYPGMNFSSSKNVPTKSEAASILNLGLALLLSRAGEHIGYFGAGRTGRSENALTILGEALLDERQENTLPTYVRGKTPKNATLILAGDFLDPLEDIEHTLRNFSGHHAGGLVLQILDPQELELSYDGRVKFGLPDYSDEELINHVPSVRDAYCSRIKKHNEELAALCRRYGWHYVMHRTDQELSETLRHIWQAMSLER